MTTILNYDEHGFIIGSKRLERGINSLSGNTEEIIRILKTQNQAASTRMARLSRNAEIINQNTPASRLRNSTSTKRSGQGGTRASSNNSSNSDSTLRGVTRRAPNHRASPNSTNNTPSSNTRTNTVRERDERGRFIGGSSRSSDDRLLKSLRSRAGVHGGGMGGAQGVDPLLDSLNEAKSLLSPVTRGAGMAGRAVKWSWSKFRSMKKREPLPRDEERHNRENEKLLTKILRQLMRGGGGRGIGGLGGLLGRGALGAGAGIAGLLGAGAGLLGRGGKSLLGGLGRLKGMKFLGPIAALAGMTDLAMSWGDMDHAGKSGGVGALAGGGGGALGGAAIGTMIFPGVGTVVGGALGAWLGSEGGEWLGRTASPHIQSWTNSLKNYNLPDKMKGVWEGGMKPFFTKLGEIGGSMGSWIEQKLRAAGDFLGISGGHGGGLDYDGPDIKPSGSFNGFGGGVDEYIKEAAGKYGIDEKVLRGFVKMEGGWTGQMSPTGAIGVGQFTQDTWNNLAKTAEGKAIGMTNINGSNFRKANDPRHNKKINTLATGLLAKKNAETLKRAGIEPTGENLYMAHNMGPGFVMAVNGKAPFTADTRRNMDVNGGKGMTPAQFMAFQKKRYLQHYADANNVTVTKAPIEPDGKPEPTPIVQAINKKAEQIVEGVKAKAGQVVDGAKEVFKKPVDEAIDEKLKDQGYGGLGVPAVKRPQLMQDVIDSIGGGSDNTVTGGANRFAPAVRHFSAPLPNLPASKLLQFSTMPKVSQRLDSGGQKPIIIQANNDTISQNVSDRGIAHAITGGLGQDRYWG